MNFLLRWKAAHARTIAFVLAWSPVSAFAYHPLITDATDIQGEAGHQIEFGYDWSHGKSGGEKTTSSGLFGAYSYGLRDDLDFLIGVSHELSEASEWGDPSIGLKWIFYNDEKSRLSFGIKPEVRMPSSKNHEAAGVGHGKTSYALTFVLTKGTDFGAVNFNIAGEHAGYALPTTERKNLYRISVAPEWRLSERWLVAFDAGLTTNSDSSQNARMGYVELGVVYSPNKDLDLSFGVIRDVLDGPADTLSATVGLTWRFS